MKVITIVLTDGEAAALASDLRQKPGGWQRRKSSALQRAEQKLAAALTTPSCPADQAGPSTTSRGGCA